MDNPFKNKYGLYIINLEYPHLTQYPYIYSSIPANTNSNGYCVPKNSGLYTGLRKLYYTNNNNFKKTKNMYP